MLRDDAFPAELAESDEDNFYLLATSGLRPRLLDV